MKNILLLLIIAIAFTTQAQQTISRDVGEFSVLKVFDLIEVNLIQSDDNRVVIKGENTENVKLVNDNGVLKIRMELEERFDGNNTFVEVYFNQIDVIDANEGAYIVVNETIDQNTIELRSQEGGRIKIGLKANHVKIRAVTGGIVEASGISESQEIKLNTGGIFEGRYLHTKDTSIGITAAGEAEVFATEKVKVRVTAGGDVIIYGNPQKVDKKSIAGGRIKVMN
ncbi:MAG: DUF2807 domain-containing protein [Bacteroidia bacterium]|nr:DUF2807 domain-containing protein [Bacteroidia bacterium]NNF31484.1 DUF2807 domain-containing protein [Flavobacteriaceae bacterium]MBT8275559.1 DUF2807 domain-containing protein [Bacteroidia bacterium]NNJ82041.1 DUF2807 domain-containing protein [Flavobacteriaceae bacterium]NNK54063.1 DUF2807 domain-containing protein [Flavobacteriaceae bacterium]